MLPNRELSSPSSLLLTAGRYGAAATLLAGAAVVAIIGSPAASASPAHRMLLVADMRTCDFQTVSYVAGRSGATPQAEITSDGHTAVASIEMIGGIPDVSYVVRMIPAPHAQIGCLPGDPSITTATLNTDDSGGAHVTLRAPIGSATTGMWLAIDRPSEYSQTPQEFYSSTFIAPV